MSLGAKSKRPRISLAVLTGKGLDLRLRLAIAAALVVSVATIATCAGSGSSQRAPGNATTGQVSGDAEAAPVAKAATPARDGLMWKSAKDGDVEDLTTLAVHEGAIGLVEAASDPELRVTAVKAMGYARGWAQLPFLAKAAAGKEDEEARLALESTLELATRPRTAEDPEDAEELREGCEGLLTLARDATRPRGRRVTTVRALRMMPCPPAKSGEGLPSDVDAK